MNTDMTENLENSQISENIPELIVAPNYPAEVSQILELDESQISTVLHFVAEGDTIPFIARYRKEKTGNLDEENIRDILKEKTRLENLFDAKRIALNGIFELGKLTDELKENIVKAQSLKEVEEIYKPYKSKKKTKAMIAIENGFQVVADDLKKNKNISPTDEILKNFLENFTFEEIIE